MSRLVAALVLAIVIGTPVAAQAADRTSVLLAELDRCDWHDPASYAPKLGILLALADGRSARELGTLIGGPRPCIGRVTSFGEGADELAFVGGGGGNGSDGALLWVDRGYWRIAPLPLGYWSGTNEVRRFGDVRELFVGLNSGGSAGTIGVLGIRIVGANASLMMKLAPSGELREARLLDDDHLYVAGRLTRDPLFTWMSHPGWPGGAQWMFERRGDVFVEVAERQSKDPEWLMTGFVGALFARDTSTMRRFATDGAIAEALDLPVLDRRIDGIKLAASRDFTANEQLAWTALPESSRAKPANGPTFGYFMNYDVQVRPVTEVGMRFDRDGDGWIITGLVRLPRGDGSSLELTR
jgi:hypothetical protein